MISVRASKILPSTLLRKLGNYVVIDLETVPEPLDGTMPALVG